MQTKIESADEARELWRRTKILFLLATPAAVVANMAVSLAEEIEEDILAAGALIYIVLLIVLLINTYIVIRKTERVTKAYTLFTIVFAPFSWIWLYPELVKPLKIIAGDSEPPTTSPVPLQPSVEEQEKRQNLNRITAVLALVGIAIAGSVAWFEDRGWPLSKRSNFDSVTFEDVTDDSSVDAFAEEHVDTTDFGFTIDFPTEPSLTTDVTFNENIQANIESATYESRTDNRLYYVLAFYYNSELMSYSNPDFVVRETLMDGIQSLVESWPGAVLMSTADEVFADQPALRFTVMSGNEHFEGMATFYGQTLYLMAVDYLDGDTGGPAEVENFIDSFHLTP